ncbi:MAG: hypothetical protein P8X90_10275 [Desulfobacterales bacterium]
MNQISSYFHGVHHDVFARRTPTDRDRRRICRRRVRITLIVMIFIAWVAPVVRAEPYEVLVVDIAAADEFGRIEEFEKDAANFNSLHRRGYSAAKPYFNLLHMADGRVYFVFGFRNKVQGLHRRDYPGTVKNLRRIKQNGVQKYPHIHWVSVEKIRRLLTGPQKSGHHSHSPGEPGLPSLNSQSSEATTGFRAAFTV